jgi:hypothetical protein
MKQRIRQEKKSYAMQRMVEAIGRAIVADSTIEKDRAARWAAAWGTLGGIRSPGVRLRSNVLMERRRTAR